MTTTDRPPALSRRPPTAPGHDGVLAAVRRHPLLTFFLLANGLSWLAWLPYILSLNGLGVRGVAFPAVLGSSQLLGVLPGAYLGPIGSALLVTAIVDGRAGLRRWVGRLLRWRVNWRWYAVTLFTVPAAALLAGVVFSGGEVHAPSATVLVAYVPLLMFQMVATGLAEEPGWRDFALARMQHRFGPLRSAFILGPLWGMWHLPLFLTEWGGWPDSSWTRPIVFVVFCISFNIVMSWVFNRTGESLPLSMLMHAGVNTFASTIAVDMFPTLDAERSLLSFTVAAVIAAVVLLVTTRGRLGFPEAAPGAGGGASIPAEPALGSRP
ncbi:MAG: CPBP family intramembrane metalloprotease [Brachybacterium sp.]|uniref:CPBP family intramembrane glutamic endopeptidase n=1 Tax=Brachybacterium sp. TaxID=1891286 RepID=UPI002649F909|nr:type II CAAX endopeptidase family protein [Brachybacterium sp.]MDN5688384.1 CPBP family intramembrane metalloprotease [Brachybacterium sp.]